MSIKLTPARLRQIVMEEAAAMRAETKKFRLTESQLRQIIREELNENNPYQDGYGDDSIMGCEFYIGADGSLHTRDPEQINDVLMNTGVDAEDLRAALEYQEGGEIPFEKFEDLENPAGEFNLMKGALRKLKIVCPDATFEGMPVFPS